MEKEPYQMTFEEYKEHRIGKLPQAYADKFTDSDLEWERQIAIKQALKKEIKS